MTPGSVLAGYGSMGQLPFPDIALEWKGNRYLRKRSHITGDPINRVEAVGVAGGTDRTRLEPTMPQAGRPRSGLRRSRPCSSDQWSRCIRA